PRTRRSPCAASRRSRRSSRRSRRGATSPARTRACAPASRARTTARACAPSSRSGRPPSAGADGADPGVTPPAPTLSGVRVRALDPTRFPAGPFGTMRLADHGADVVKGEPRRAREFRPTGAARDGYFFLSANRGKRSLTLDLGRAEGRALLVRLLPHFDVLV